MPLHSPSEMYKCQDLATFLPSHQEELICRRSDILTNLVQNSTRKKKSSQIERLKHSQDLLIVITVALGIQHTKQKINLHLICVMIV